MCADNRSGECPMHGPLHSLRRLVGTSAPPASASSSLRPEPPASVRASLPRELCLSGSGLPGAGLGLCAAQRLPAGTWLGPYDGARVPVERLRAGAVRNTRHLWEVYDSDGCLLHFLDGSEPGRSSWMRYIRCARHRAEQNLSVLQHKSCIFYRACADIPRGSELLVWYDESYASFLGIPLQHVAQDDTANVPLSAAEAVSRHEALSPLGKAGKLPPPAVHWPSQALPAAGRSYPQGDRPGAAYSYGCNGSASVGGSPGSGMGLGGLGGGAGGGGLGGHKVLASPTSTSQLGGEFSDWHLWKCGQCFKTFTQRILLQMHVCSQNPDRCVSARMADGTPKSR